MNEYIADRQANSGSLCIIEIYKRLLADICELSAVHLCTPDEITYEWVLKLGPKLDKELLMFLEGSGTLPDFPEWIKPLVDAFLSTLDGKLLRYLRQLLLFCYKVEQIPTNEQLKEAQASFEDTDSSIAIWDAHFGATDKHMFESARKIVARVIYPIDWTSIVPSHGPGAVYPSEEPSEKGNFRHIYTNIEKYYPYYEYLCCLPSVAYGIGSSRRYSLVESETIPARLVAVPKDSRGPRLICVHPKEAIWIQQGCRRLLERAISSPRSVCRGRIVFDDQSVNGGLALASSVDREYCTLDLKEASDRMSCTLVKYLFGNFAYEYISCSRATHVKLLDGRVITLRKWAPMGNCLTFPVQSLVFYALVVAGIRSRYGINCTDVYVFGDDILFPSKYYDGALHGLIRAGLIPNIGKTFRHGFFRESCGVDAFKGVDVTPHRLKKTNVKSVSGATSLCTMARAMGRDGYRLTSDAMYRVLSREYGRLPISNNPHAQGIYRYEACSLETLLKYEPSLRFKKTHQKWVTRLLLVGGAQKRISNGAWWHLQDSIIRLHLGAAEVSDRGLEYAVPHRSRLKRGWTDALVRP